MAGNPESVPLSSLKEDEDRFTSAYKIMKNPYRIGTIATKICSWSHIEGYKRESPPLAYDPDTTPHTFQPGPVVIRVTDHIRGNDLSVTVTYRKCIKTNLFTTDRVTVSGKVYYDEVFQDDGYHTLSFTIPAGTRKTVCLFDNFDKYVWDVTEVAVTGSMAGDAFDIHILQGTNCRLFYGYNWDELMKKVDDISLSRFSSLRRCVTCEGSGESNYLDGSTAVCPLCNGAGNLLAVDGFWLNETCWNCDGTGTVCPSCLGSGLWGECATLKALYRIGERFGIFRKSSSETDNMLRKRINTRAWWVTPNDADAVRFFAKIADVPEAYVKLVKREDSHEPCWYIFVPTFSGYHSYFQYGTTDALEYVEFAESMTPLGVNYIVGWYDRVSRRDPGGSEIVLTDRGSKRLCRDVIGSYIDHCHINNADVSDYIEDYTVVAREDPLQANQLMFFDWANAAEINDWLPMIAGNAADLTIDNVVFRTGASSLLTNTTAVDAFWCHFERTNRGRFSIFVRPRQTNLGFTFGVMLNTGLVYAAPLPEMLTSIYFLDTGIVAYQRYNGMVTNITWNDGTGVVNYTYDANRWYKVDLKWDKDANRQWIRVTDCEAPYKKGIISNEMINHVAGGVAGGYDAFLFILGNVGTVVNFDRLTVGEVKTHINQGF